MGKEVGDVTASMRPQLLGKVRRQAAKVVGTLLKGDADRRASASMKSLIYAPSVVAKKATLALTCQTLKYLPVLKEVIAFTDLLSGKKKDARGAGLCASMRPFIWPDTGDAEKQVLTRKSALRSALARLLVKRNVSSAEELLPLEAQNSGPAIPRYVRVNTLKMSTRKAITILRESIKDVEIDDLIQDLLVLPPGTDLHKHPLVLNGSIVLQGKASCMPAQALSPACDWEVLDACAAPGNKTVHLAALMAGRGKITACEINEKRAQRLQETVRLTGATNVTVRQQDFLTIDPTLPEFTKVRGILLDPSCSGSGTTVQRLDHLLPSAGTDKNDDQEKDRIEQLARFQETALLHALSFPSLEKLVYSTCSIHQRENEDVVLAVLPHAKEKGFELSNPFPSWPHRGLPVFEGADLLIRTDALRDKMDGFFVALFVRKSSSSTSKKASDELESLDPEGHCEKEQDARTSLQRRRKLKRQRKKEQQALNAKIN
nr:probable 28S rRNA (cytosine-C(5))-methyltransferase isoform X2 [Physcomitrium patens]|eukprot:XP_024365029.1 probable 28S rRNA (cytosine-C(5))-methyltransferase isoform X2 [Physcomitrella patens]